MEPTKNDEFNAAKTYAVKGAHELPLHDSQPEHGQHVHWRAQPAVHLVNRNFPKENVWDL